MTTCIIKGTQVKQQIWIRITVDNVQPDKFCIQLITIKLFCSAC